MTRTPGWMVLGQKAAILAGLTMLDRLLGPARERRDFAPAPQPHVPGPAADAPQLRVPDFIAEVTDPGARHYRIAGQPLFAGLYSDGRVRLATPDGKRYSGFVVNGKAVVADLHEDVSFEMTIAQTAGGNAVTADIDGGPYDGKHLRLEPLT